MSYHLGIDLGTTYTAAATHEAGRIEVVRLGDRGPSIPSVLFLRPDGNVVAGDTANRQAVTNPERVAREFKRRLGDPTPISLGGVPTPPELLTGHLLRWVYDVVVRAKGALPDALALTHPANWGNYKCDLLRRAAETAGLTDVMLVTEPQAAAISYASQERVEPGSVVAVYDLGGGTFDAAVLRKEHDGGFTILGSPEGIERLGGIDFDAAVFEHVRLALEDVFDELDPEDPATMAAAARLRQECTQAKEALSLDSEAVIPVLLPNAQTEVRATRGELEDMIRPALAETVTALERALRSADVEAGQVDHVLLVGGSSRIPVVAEMVSRELGRPVAIDAHPKHAVALGAAIVAARAVGVTVGDALNGTPSAVPGAPLSAPITPPFGVGLPPIPAPGALVPAGVAAPPAGGMHVGPEEHAALASLPTAHMRRQNGSARYVAPSPPPVPPPPFAPPPAVDPTFDAAQSEAPPPSLGYQAASRPPPPGAPPPGSSVGLPPGYLTPQQRVDVERRQASTRRWAVLAGAVVVVLGVVATMALMARRNAPAATLADMQVRDCYVGDDVSDVEIVDCTEAHHGELFAVVGTEGLADEYMGEEALTRDRHDHCVLALAMDYYGAGPDVATANGIEVRPFVPTEAAWNDGRRDTYCVAVPATGGTVEGSIEGEGRGQTAPPPPAPQAPPSQPPASQPPARQVPPSLLPPRQSLPPTPAD